MYWQPLPPEDDREHAALLLGLSSHSHNRHSDHHHRLLSDKAAEDGAPPLAGHNGATTNTAKSSVNFLLNDIMPSASTCAKTGRPMLPPLRSLYSPPERGPPSFPPHLVLPPRPPQPATAASCASGTAGLHVPPQPMTAEEESKLRLRREMHLQQQRRLLLQLLQDKQQEIDKRWGHSAGHLHDEPVKATNQIAPPAPSSMSASAPSSSSSPLLSNGREPGGQTSLSLTNRHSLADLDEDDEGTNPHELTRLYGGSNQSQHRQAIELVRQRRQRPGRSVEPSHGSESGTKGEPAVEERRASLPGLPSTRPEQEDGEADLDWGDVGTTARFRSSMPPFPAHLYRRLSGAHSSSSPSRTSEPSPPSSSSSTTTSSSSSTSSSCPSSVERPASPLSDSQLDNHDENGVQGPDDGRGVKRLRASPAQMQMLHHILSSYEQSPQKMEEVERQAVAPVRRRRRRNKGVPLAPLSSSGTASSAEAGSSSPSLAAGDEDGATDDGDLDVDGSARKRRKREREMLVFHHMNVQDDGKVVVTQRI